MVPGTAAYRENSIVNSALPCVAERSTVEKPNISASGTSASTREKPSPSVLPMMMKGPLIHAPVVGFKVTLTDGAYHAVDSSDIAFQEAARGAFREVYPKAAPQILEPIMKVAVEGPSDFHGGIVGLLMQRRGIVIGTTEGDGFSRVESEVPLAEMFGFSTVLRSATQGKAEFTMEFSRYAAVPGNIGEELIKKHRDELAKKAK
jgi:elongation factor G